MKRLLSILSLAILFGAPMFAGGEPDAPSIVFEEEMAIGYIEMRPQPGVNEGYPSVGDNVTWVAHVWNRTEWWNVRAKYRWYINGVQVEQRQKRMKSYEESGHTTNEIEYTTTWTGNDDVITFEIYWTDFWPEVEEGNNTISVIATAHPVGAYVEQSFYYHFQENQKYLTGAHSRCFGDWMHRHIDTLNTLMGQAVYTPEAPSGATDRFRLQKVTIVPDGSLPMSGSDAINYPNPNDTLVDVQLGFTADMVDDYDDYYTTGSYNPFYYDITVLQRILKTRYAIELTAWDVEDNTSDRNIQILEDGEYVAGSDLMPWLGAYSEAVHYNDENGVMGDDFSQIAKYTAVTLNLIAGDRATEGNGYPPENLHEYLNDLPAENKLTIHDVDGVPLDYANVQIFQSEGDGSTWYSKSFDNSADMSFTTNASGEALVGMCPFSVDGEVVHEFGRSTTVAIMRIQYDSKVDYQFLESKDFNYEYWAGNTTLGTYDVYTDFKSHDLDLLSPNGGEVWRVGATMDIVWDGVKVPTAILEYSTNGGSSWTTITSAGSGVTERYSWTIPNEVSSNCLVRVIDASDATVGDTSDAAFSIAQASIAVAAPNGGETVTVGDGLDIRWNASNMPTVNVQISRNNGASWETVASNVPGDAGSYYWTVSGTATTTALARVEDTYDASINDVSDAVFTIQGLSVTPNVWFVDASVGSSGDGTTEATAFKTINEAIQAADPYDTIKVLPGTYTSFESTASRDERIAIVSTGGADVAILDGTGVATGRAFRVKAGWTIDGFTFTNFDNAADPNNAVINFNADVDSSSAVVVRNCVFDGNAKIAVGIDGSYAKTIYERNVFMNGSDRVIKGEWRDVRIYNNVFADNGDGSADYAIYIYNRNQAETRVDIRNNSFVSNDLSGATDGLVKVEPQLSGNVIRLTEGNNAYYGNTPSSAIVAGTRGDATTIENRLGGDVTADPNHVSVSTGDFALVVGSPLIDAGANLGASYEGAAPEIGAYEGTGVSVAVTYPNGGEGLPVGETYDVTWTSQNVENVKIEYTVNGGSSWSDIVASAPAADGAYSWSVPENLSSNCKVRVSAVERPQLSDESDATFTIRVAYNIWVDDDGSPTGTGTPLNPVNTIAKALQLANEGDTVRVKAGTYSSNTDDPNNSPIRVAIIAADSGQVVIDDGPNPVFRPKKGWTIDGLKFINNTASNGIFYFDMQYVDEELVTISNCVFDNNEIIMKTTGWGTINAVKMHHNYIMNTNNIIADNFYFKTFIFRNNTYYHNYVGWESFYLVGYGDEETLDVRNNIIAFNDEGWNKEDIFYVTTWENKQTLEFTHGYNVFHDTRNNLFDVRRFRTVNETDLGNFLEIDPEFVDAASKDLRLELTSPLINRGTDVGLDYFSSAPEIGAYEDRTPPEITLTSLTGGENVRIGDVVNLTWTHINVGLATIDYSTDGGANWITVAEDVDGKDLSYAWTVPYPRTENALIRMTDRLDANATDQSATTFSILNDTIYVNASGGADYTNIATALSNAEDGAEIFVASGTYTAAGIATPPRGVVLRSESGAGSTIIDGSSLSGLGFTVNEGWTIDGFTFQNFNDGGTMSDAVIVFESTSDSAYWATIENNVFKNSTKLFLGETGSEARALVNNNVIYDGSERVAYGEWRAFRFLNNTVENVSNTGDNYIIDVFASGQNETRLDVRNNVFSNNTVASGGGAFIHATPSASGKTLIVKEGHNLFFNNSPNSTITVEDVAGANEYHQSFGFNKTTDPLYLDAASDDYGLAAGSPAVVAGMDVGLPFEGPNPDMGALPYSGTITLGSPNGGETWASGNSETITWTYDNVLNVKIEISTDGGATWVYQIPSTPAASGSYTLNAPNMPTNDAIVQLSIAETEEAQDASDAPFSILSSDAPIVDGNTTVEPQWATTLYTDASAGDQSHMTGVYTANDLNFVYFGIMLEEDDCRNNATIVIDYKPGGPAANSSDPFQSKIKYNFQNQPDYVIHKHGYGSTIAAKRWNGSSWQDRTAPEASGDFFSNVNGGNPHFLEIKLPREELDNANVINVTVFTSEGSNATTADADKCAFYAYPDVAGNQTDPTGAASSTTMSVYHEELVIIPNVNNQLGGPYMGDANTVALFHFDGDYTNAGTTADATAVNSGSQSFVEHTDQALGNLRQALRIDNSNSANKTYLRVADANELDMTGDWTIEMWFKVNSFGPENGYAYSPRLISKPNGTSPVGNYWVNLFGNESVAQAGMTTTSGTYNVIKSDSAFVQTGNWYHLSYVHDATKEMMAMIVHDANRNPVFVQTKSLAGIANTPVTSTSDLYIGWAGGAYASMFYFDGWIDELRVSDAVRSFNVPPMVENVTKLANQNPNPAGYDISATIFPLDAGAWLADQRLRYSIDGGESWTSLEMSQVSGNVYSATIPEQAAGADILYYVWAKDNYNNEARTPAGDDVYYRFGVYRAADKALDLAFDQNVSDASIYNQSPVVNGDVSYLVDKKEGTHSLRFPVATSPSSISVDSPFLTGEQFDVQFWFKPLTALRDQTKLVVRPFLPGSTVNENYSITLFADGSLRARYRVAFDLGIENVDLRLPAGTVQLGQWYHTTYVRTNDSVYVELRNSMDALVARSSKTSVSAKPPHSAMGPLKIGWAGNAYNGENAYFTGMIDGLTINNLSRSLGKALPTIDSAWTNLAVTDREGRMTTLFLAEDGQAASSFPEIPTMPEGTYDVRFTSDRFVETTGVERRVSLKGVEYPVTLAAGGKAVRIVDAFGGAHIKETLRPGETLTIDNETIDELAIQEWTVPEEFELYRNFPNPFNPTTTLRFDLPIDGAVKLEVYDILGQKVETLFDGELEAGVHEMKWNAIDYASGVYVYRIETNEFTAVKKMVLMK